MDSNQGPRPDDDIGAAAIRRALRRLAPAASARTLPWTVVAASARRVKRRRILAAAGVSVLVLLSGPAAVATVNGGGDRLSTDGGAPGSTTTVAPSPTTETPTTGTPTTDTPPTDTPTTESPTTVPGTTTPTTDPGPCACPATVEPGDVVGTLRVPATVTAGVGTPFTLTVRNTTDHTIVVPADSPRFGVVATSDLPFSVFVDLGSGELTLAAGAEHEFTGSLVADAEMAGPTRVLAALFVYDNGVTLEYLDGVPAVAITVLTAMTSTTR